MHAMRGISAHANGFQTCRMLHLLQILLGSIDCPGGFRYKAPFPRPTPPPSRAGSRATRARRSRCKGAPLGFPQGPEDLLVDAGGRPQRIDKAYSWDAPLAAHGMMHMVITNAANADPYPVDVLFMYMANMSWNSSMNIPAVLKHLTAKDHKTGDYNIPKIIYSDAYFSEMVPYADLILPDTTYLERWDCISLLDRPISEPDGPADAIRQPVVAPDRDVRAVPERADRASARGSKLPGFVTDAGAPHFPGGYPDYIVNHERGPGIGPLAGFRGADGNSYGRGEPNPRQLEPYIADGCFHEHHLAPEQRYYKHANKAYLDWAQGRRLHRRDAAPIIFQLYLEPLQKFRLPRAATATSCRRPRTAPASRTISIRSRSGIRRSRTRREREREFPDSRPSRSGRCTMYHSWGSHNAWLRQITAENCLYMQRGRARMRSASPTATGSGSTSAHRPGEGAGAADGWRQSRHGVDLERDRPARRRRPRSTPDAPEATRGFLLNHLITELLPEREGGYRFSNSDPITGQAAWYDLRVRIEKAAPSEAQRDLRRGSSRSSRRRSPQAEAAP